MKGVGFWLVVGCEEIVLTVTLKLSTDEMRIPIRTACNIAAACGIGHLLDGITAAGYYPGAS
jgi:hypothetical protein